MFGMHGKARQGAYEKEIIVGTWSAGRLRRRDWDFDHD